LKIKRKVILHGPSTLTVSLPSKWVKGNNIKKGDEINVEEAGAMLKIYSGEANLLTKKTSIDVSNLDSQSIRIMITVLHKSGYDEIEVKFKDAGTVKVIQERINSRLIGYEIIEQKGNYCVLKNVAGDNLPELNTLIRRSFLVALSMANNSLEEVKNSDMKKLKELLVLEKTNNKIVNYCQRLLNKKPYKDEKTVFTYLIIWLIESICDDYRDLINVILNQPKFKISPVALRLYAEINNLFSDYYNFYYKYSDKQFEIMQHKIIELKQALNKTKFSNQEIAFRPYFFSIINRLFDALGSTVGLHH